MTSEQAAINGTEPPVTLLEPGNGHKAQSTALVPLSKNGGRRSLTPQSRRPSGANTGNGAAPAATVAPAAVQLNDELVNQILRGRGLRGWWRAANIGRVLGTLSLYLFLDTYEVRANFNRRCDNCRSKSSFKSSARGYRSAG